MPVCADEYEVDRVGVSRKGSLGARGRRVWVVEAMGGGFCDRVVGVRSEGSGCDCDRECMGDRGVNAGKLLAELVVEGVRLSDVVSSKARTCAARQLTRLRTAGSKTYPFEYVNSLKHEIFPSGGRQLPNSYSISLSMWGLCEAHVPSFLEHRVVYFPLDPVRTCSSQFLRYHL